MTRSLFQLSALGFKLYATPDTSAFLSARGIANEAVAYPASESAADLAAAPIIRLMKEGAVDLVINATPPGRSSQPLLNYHVRRTAVDFGVPLLTNPALIRMFAAAMDSRKGAPISGMSPEAPPALNLLEFYAGAAAAPKPAASPRSSVSL